MTLITAYVKTVKLKTLKRTCSISDFVNESRISFANVSTLNYKTFQV